MSRRGISQPPTKPVWLALPAMVALLACALGALVVVVARPDRTALVERYERDADRALAVGDGPTARLCAQRLIQLAPEDPANRDRLTLANALGR